MVNHEIEAKFECSPDGVDRLRALADLDGYRLHSEREITQDDVYFDTAGWVLRANSASLRLRRIASDTLLATYKGPRELIDAGQGAQAVSRPEIEDPVSLPAGSSDDLSPGLLARTPALRHAESAFGPLELVPVARLITRRWLKRFTRDDEPELELALDQSTGTRLSDGRRVEFVEVELESLTEDVPALRAAIATLRDACPGLQPSETTKLARTLD